MRQPQPFDATAFDPPVSDPWLADAELVRGAGRRVLIVDDEPLLAERMCANEPPF